MPNFEYEDKHYAEGYTAVCGCDEAGRGPLCGRGVRRRKAAMLTVD